MKATSLHRRLVTILLGLTLFSWLISVSVTAINAQFLIQHQIDQQLNEFMDMSLYTLNMVLEDKTTTRYFKARNPPLSVDNNLVRIPGYGSQGQKQAINIWHGDHQVLVGDNTPEFPDPVAEGFRDVQILQEGEATPWRILYHNEARQNSWLAVGLNLSRAQHVTATTFSRVMLPLAIILPLSIAVLLLGIKRGLAPLNILADKIASRKAIDQEPINLEGVPKELSPLVNALNQLLNRLQVTLTSEQRFTANAAHELQTPLTAIKAEVQRYQREANSDSARLMLDSISMRVTRATDTVRQLLTLARLDPDQRMEFQIVDLQQLLLEVVAGHGAIAVDRQLEFNIEESRQPALVNGNPDWLAILLHNLIVNALNYAIAPGVIDIQIVADSENVRLSIANDCPLIPSEELAELTRRFYRVSNNSRPGSGLGLSIAERIIELHKGTLTLSRWREEGGFRADVTLPANP